MRDALSRVPVKQLPVILQDCGLTAEEIECLIEYCDKANRTWIAGKLHVSDRTVDRIRLRALERLCAELDE